MSKTIKHLAHITKTDCAAGPHTAAHAAAAQARASDAQQQPPPTAAATQPLSQEEHVQLVRDRMDRMAAMRGYVTGPAGPTPPGQTSAGGLTQPPAAATISLGEVHCLAQRARSHQGWLGCCSWTWNWGIA